MTRAPAEFGGSALARKLVPLLLPLALLLPPAALGTALAPVSALAADQYDYDAAGRLIRVTHHSGRITEYSYDGNGNVLTVLTSLATAVEPSTEGRVFQNALGACHPNPASRDVRLGFSLAKHGNATLCVYDVAGRLVLTVANHSYEAGEYEARIAVSRWASGVYFYKLEAPGFRATRRLVVVR